MEMRTDEILWAGLHAGPVHVLNTHTHRLVYSIETPSCKTEMHETRVFSNALVKHIHTIKEITLTHPRMLRQTLPLR